jgi:Kef-type K+ transport system membrane component KefB
LLPLFFTICGIRIDIWSLFDKKAHLAMGSVVVVLSCSAKILSTLLVSFYENVPARDGFSLGIVLNTKGILAILILQLGNSGEVISLSLSLSHPNFTCFVIITNSCHGLQMWTFHDRYINNWL